MDLLNKDLDSKIYFSSLEVASMVCSKTVIMLWLVFFHCCSSSVEGGCHVVLSVLSSLTIISLRKRELIALLFVILILCDFV